MSSNNTQLKTRRVFLALWPDDIVRQQLVAAFEQTAQVSLQATLKTKRLRPENLHLTLHFLGNITQQQFDCVHKVASEIRLPAFNLTLNHYGFFDRAGVFWMGPESAPAALTQLHDSLARALIHCECFTDKRKFVPHITLVRKLKTAVQLADCLPESVNWHIQRFALIESIAGSDGVDYIPQAFYPLF